MNLLRDLYYLYLKHGCKGAPGGLYLEQDQDKDGGKESPPHHRRNHKEGQCGKVTGAAVTP